MIFIWQAPNVHANTYKMLYFLRNFFWSMRIFLLVNTQFGQSWCPLKYQNTLLSIPHSMLNCAFILVSFSLLFNFYISIFNHLTLCPTYSLYPSMLNFALSFYFFWYITLFLCLMTHLHLSLSTYLTMYIRRLPLYA